MIRSFDVLCLLLNANTRGSAHSVFDGHQERDTHFATKRIICTRAELAITEAGLSVRDNLEVVVTVCRNLDRLPHRSGCGATVQPIIGCELIGSGVMCPDAIDC